jgi:hypothetical protein
MRFILFICALFAVTQSSKLNKQHIDNIAASGANGLAINNGIGAATAVALSMANNVNVATNVNTNVRVGDVRLR